METRLVRLKPHDPRQRHVLRRFTYAGIRFSEERGWHRVSKEVADHLTTVRQVHDDEFAPLAFDVATDEEAQQVDIREQKEAEVRRLATSEIELLIARGEATKDGGAQTPTKPETPSAKRKA